MLFRSPSIEHALGYLGAFFQPGALPLEVALAAEPPVLIALAIGCASALIPATWVTGVRLQQPDLLVNRAARLVTAAVLLPAALVLVLTGTFSPFLYFQF